MSLQSCVLRIGLDINPKTSGQQHYVELPFNKQGFEHSLARVAMNNHYRCKAFPNTPPPGSNICSG
jgi:hypothetical protein